HSTKGPATTLEHLRGSAAVRFRPEPDHAASYRARPPTGCRPPRSRSPPSRVRSAEFFRRQTQLPQLVIECPLGNPQGAAHHRRVAVVLGERIFDQNAFKPMDLITERNLRKGAREQNRDR